MVKIRLARGGAKKNPFYSIVATDSRKRRDSGYIERIGYFNPVARGQEVRLQLEEDRLSHWISQGAQISDRVKQLVKEYRDPSIREKQLAKQAAKADDKAKKIAAEEKAKADLEAKEVAEEAAAAEAAAAEAAAEAPAEEAAAEAPAEEAAAEAQQKLQQKKPQQKLQQKKPQQKLQQKKPQQKLQQKKPQQKKSQLKNLKKNNLVSSAPHSNEKKLLVGKINGFFGLQGWVKVFSYTKPRVNILNYSPWSIDVDGELQKIEIKNGREQSKTIVAHISGIDTREDSQKLIGKDIYIDKEQLPELNEDQYYWHELIGFTVLNQNKESLGLVDYFVETGANNVLVVKGKKEHWIPYIEPYLVSVDSKKKEIFVDWDKDF